MRLCRYFGIILILFFSSYSFGFVYQSLGYQTMREPQPENGFMANPSCVPSGDSSGMKVRARSNNKTGEVYTEYDDGYIYNTWFERTDRFFMAIGRYGWGEEMRVQGVDSADMPLIMDVLKKSMQGDCKDASRVSDFLKMLANGDLKKQSHDMGDGQPPLEGYAFGNDHVSCFISTTSEYASSCSPKGELSSNGDPILSIDDISVSDYLSNSAVDNNSSNNGSSAGSSSSSGSSSSGSSSSGSSAGSSSAGSSSGGSSSGGSSSGGSSSGGSSSGSGSSGGSAVGQGSGDGDGDGDCEGDDCSDGDSDFPSLPEFDLKGAFSEFKKSQEERFKNFSVDTSGGTCSPVNISADFGIFSVSENIDLHCKIFSTVSGLLTGVFMFFWSLMSIRVVLSA